MKEDIRKVFECSTISSFKPKFECKRPYLNIVCEKFMVRKDPKPKPKKSKENQKKEIKYDETRLVHGLLRCKSGCGLWNRDRNGSSNIYKIAETAINKLERPSYLCREIKSNQAVLPNCYKQTIQGTEKPNLKLIKVKRLKIVPF